MGSVNPLPESVPALDQFPLGAVQAVAPVEPQMRVDRPPLGTELGEAERVAVGGAIQEAGIVTDSPPVVM